MSETYHIVTWLWYVIVLFCHVLKYRAWTTFLLHLIFHGKNPAGNIFSHADTFGLDAEKCLEVGTERVIHR